MSTPKRTTTKRAAVPATSASGVVDLSDIEASIRRQDEGIVVDIMGPDGKTPLGLRIRVAGPDSARAVAAQDELTDEIVAEGLTEKVTQAVRRDHNFRLLAKMTIGWEGQVKVGGQLLDFSEAAALKIYRQFSTIIAPQVDKAVDRSRFTKG